MKLSSPGRQAGYSGYLSAAYLITKTGPDKVLKAVDQPRASYYYFPPVQCSEGLGETSVQTTVQTTVRSGNNRNQT